MADSNTPQEDKKTKLAYGRLKAGIEILTSALTSFAIIAAAVWFYFRGLGEPMLVMPSIEAKAFCMPGNKRFIRGRFKIENIGNIPVSLNEGLFRVNSMLPIEKEFFEVRSMVHGDIQWPSATLTVERNLENIRLMPGEYHFETIDFLIDSGAELIELQGEVNIHKNSAQTLKRGMMKHGNSPRPEGDEVSRKSNTETWGNEIIVDLRGKEKCAS